MERQWAPHHHIGGFQLVLQQKGRHSESSLGELQGRFDKRPVGLYRTRAVRLCRRQGHRELLQHVLYPQRNAGSAFP